MRTRPKTAVHDGPTSSFPAVFDAFVQAVRESGHAVELLDRRNGRIIFRTRPRWLTPGQEFSLVVVDKGDGSCALEAVIGERRWFGRGDGRAVVARLTHQARALLARRGGEDWLR